METYFLNVGGDKRRRISCHAHKQSLVSRVADGVSIAFTQTIVSFCRSPHTALSEMHRSLVSAEHRVPVTTVK